VRAKDVSLKMKQKKFFFIEICFSSSYPGNDSFACCLANESIGSVEVDGKYLPRNRDQLPANLCFAFRWKISELTRIFEVGFKSFCCEFL
jgi:hypothetical protein